MGEFKKKKLCIFSANYLPNVGGVEVYTECLARKLVERGIEVTVVTNNIFNLPDLVDDGSGLRLFRLPCYPLVDARYPIPRLNRRFRDLWTSLESDRFDGVLVNTRFYIHSFMGLLIAKHSGVKPALIDHGSGYLSFGKPVLDPIVAAYEQVVTRLQKTIFSVDYYGVSSESLKWLSSFGIQGKGVLGGAIDAEEFRRCSSGRSFRSELGISEDSLVVVYAGRLIGEKGIDFILEALRDPWVACHDVVFLVAGAGPLRSEIERVEGRNLRFLGALDRPDVSALLQESDVFCGLSKSEGFGYSMLEAAICGAFLIVTDVGIASDLCPDDSFGCVVDRPSAAKLIEVLQKCSDDRSWMKRLAGKCSTRAEGLFSWDNAADAVVRACLR